MWSPLRVTGITAKGREAACPWCREEDAKTRSPGCVAPRVTGRDLKLTSRRGTLLQWNLIAGSECWPCKILISIITWVFEGEVTCACRRG